MSDKKTPTQIVYEELTIAGDVYKLLYPLDGKARTRVLDWIVAKLEEDRDKEALKLQGVAKS